MTVATALVLYYYASNSAFKRPEKKPKKREKKCERKKKNPKIINVAPRIGPSLLSPITTVYARENSLYPLPLSLLLYHICLLLKNYAASWYIKKE